MSKWPKKRIPLGFIWNVGPLILDPQKSVLPSSTSRRTAVFKFNMANLEAFHAFIIRLLWGSQKTRSQQIGALQRMGSSSSSFYLRQSYRQREFRVNRVALRNYSRAPGLNGLFLNIHIFCNLARQSFECKRGAKSLHMFLIVTFGFWWHFAEYFLSVKKKTLVAVLLRTVIVF